MVIQLSGTPEPTRDLGSERRLWHDGSRYTPSLGCTNCPEQSVCGGLRIGRALYDCLGLCSCKDRTTCDAVCRNKPVDFARRVREVGGFAFDNVPRAPILPTPFLPVVVPTLYHGNRRVASFSAAAVCLSLYRVVQRHTGEIRYSNGAEIATAFGITPNTPLILTGTAADPPLERWWSLSSKRRAAIRALRNFNISLVTTPNYSLFIDQPRWDDLHSMKRIAIVHEEFLSEGVPTALHVNARTDRDWDRWTTYIADRPEVTHIAFEFATGAGWAKRVKWHTNKLSALARDINRPLHLVVRGGKNVLPDLATAFSSITLLETSVFMKTMRRQRAILRRSGKSELAAVAHDRNRTTRQVACR
jgi:hypothetical protein